MRTLQILILTILLAACTNAQRATEVRSIRLPIAPYLKMSCKALVSEQRQLIRHAQSMSTEVDTTYRSDKNIELVSWFLFWPAAFFYDGNQEEASKLAAIMGQGATVQEALKVNGCFS